VLVVAWLLGALRAGGPYPVLAIAGEQGSAKTVLSKLLRALIDPSVAPVRALPRDERELFIAASNGHVLAFDNLSGLPPWLSDTLCRLTSGGAFSTRRLFTDQDEILFAAARPIILNGILARSSIRPRMEYACCRMYVSGGCRAWLILRSGPQHARAHFDPREAHPTFCRSASILAAMLWPLGPALAGQRVPAHSLAGCAGPRPSSAHSGLRSSSAAKGGWERGPWITAKGENHGSGTEQCG
jgi:hypothetical protein